MLSIVATPLGGGQGFVICESTGARGPGSSLFVGDFSGTFSSSNQQVTYLDAEQSVNVPLPGKGQSGDIPCDVEYEFATEGACLSFIKRLQYDVPVLGNVVVTAGGVSMTIPKVYLRPLRWSMIGQVACRVEYPLKFGLVI